MAGGGAVARSVGKAWRLRSYLTLALTKLVTFSLVDCAMWKGNEPGHRARQAPVPLRMVGATPSFEPK